MGDGRPVRPADGPVDHIGDLHHLHFVRTDRLHFLDALVVEVVMAVRQHFLKFLGTLRGMRVLDVHVHVVGVRGVEQPVQHGEIHLVIPVVVRL